MDLKSDVLTNVGLGVMAFNLKVFSLGSFVLCQGQSIKQSHRPLFFKFKERKKIKTKPHHRHLDGIKEKSVLPEATRLLQS